MLLFPFFQFLSRHLDVRYIRYAGGNWWLLVNFDDSVLLFELTCHIGGVTVLNIASIEHPYHFVSVFARRRIKEDLDFRAAVNC